MNSDSYYDYEREPLREWEQDEWCADCGEVTVHLWLKWQPFGQVTNECQGCGMVADQW